MVFLHCTSQTVAMNELAELVLVVRTSVLEKHCDGLPAGRSSVVTPWPACLDATAELSQFCWDRIPASLRELVAAAVPSVARKYRKRNGAPLADVDNSNAVSETPSATPTVCKPVIHRV